MSIKKIILAGAMAALSSTANAEMVFDTSGPGGFCRDLSTAGTIAQVVARHHQDTAQNLSMELQGKAVKNMYINGVPGEYRRMMLDMIDATVFLAFEMKDYDSEKFNRNVYFTCLDTTSPK